MRILDSLLLVIMGKETWILTPPAPGYLRHFSEFHQTPGLHHVRPFLPWYSSDPPAHYHHKTPNQHANNQVRCLYVPKVVGEDRI
jgi:hypothetical protein